MAYYSTNKTRVAEILPNELYLALVQRPGAGIPADIPTNSLCYWLDDDLIYEPFCADFGPCNLAHTYRFCMRVNNLMKQAAQQKRTAYLLVGPHPHKRANAAALVGIYSVLFLDKTPAEAYAPLQLLEPFEGFRDASSGIALYEMEVPAVICGMAKARDVGFIRWAQGEEFDVEEYEHYEQVENGDFNWIVPGKLLAFSGPSAQPKYYAGWRTFTPEDYVDYFHENNVTAVVRLNKKMYEACQFEDNGVKHYDMYFPDGTCPTEEIMQEFLRLVDAERGALAVHCKAGLGRTGVLICCYMIRNYGFTAEEAMGYIRVCRPGSVLGPQQNYLLQHAPRLLYEGRVHRASMKLQACKLPSSRPCSMEVNQSSEDSNRLNNKRGSVIHITARSSSVDMVDATMHNGVTVQQQEVRRSPRLNKGAVEEAPVESNNRMHLSMGGARSPVLSPFEEPTHIVSIGSGRKPQQSSTTPNKDRPPTPLRQNSLPLNLMKMQSTQSSDWNATATPSASSKLPQVPPSSTKRVMAPNGQPRKIPLAMDFDAVANAHELEDRDMMDADDSWTLSSQAQSYEAQDKNAINGKRVGVLAAAAGRSANAFVDAFRGVMGVYRTNSTRRH